MNFTISFFKNVKDLTIFFFIFNTNFIFYCCSFFFSNCDFSNFYFSNTDFLNNDYIDFKLKKNYIENQYKNKNHELNYIVNRIVFEHNGEKYKIKLTHSCDNVQNLPDQNNLINNGPIEI